MVPAIQHRVRGSPMGVMSFCLGACKAVQVPHCTVSADTTKGTAFHTMVIAGLPNCLSSVTSHSCGFPRAIHSILREPLHAPSAPALLLYLCGTGTCLLLWILTTLSTEHLYFVLRLWERARRSQALVRGKWGA